MFTLGDMYRELLPRLPTPLLELTTFFKLTPLIRVGPFIESTSLRVSSSLRQDVYFPTLKNVQGFPTTSLDLASCTAARILKKGAS